jgi:hypothetical protein
MNCKPGILAYIAHSTLPQNIGKVVEVIAADLSRLPGESIEAPRWVIKHRSPMHVVIRGTREIVIRAPGTLMSAPDAWLRPISGVPVNDEVTEEITA